MAKIKIPLRPNSKTKYELSNDEMDCIVWNIVFNQSRIDCWMRFVCPEAETQIKAKREASCEAWWSGEQVRKFIKDYNKTLDEIFNPSTKKTKENNVELDPKAVTRKLSQKALKVADESDINTVEDVVNVTDALKPFGYLKEQEEIQVAPIRYLPTRCDECRYKKFIDEQIKEGNIIEEN